MKPHRCRLGTTECAAAPCQAWRCLALCASDGRCTIPRPQLPPHDFAKTLDVACRAPREASANATRQRRQTRAVRSQDLWDSGCVPDDVQYGVQLYGKVSRLARLPDRAAVAARWRAGKREPRFGSAGHDDQSLGAAWLVPRRRRPRTWASPSTYRCAPCRSFLLRAVPARRRRPVPVCTPKQPHTSLPASVVGRFGQHGSHQQRKRTLFFLAGGVARR